MYATLVSMMERAFLLYTAIDRFDKESGENSTGRTRFVTCLDKTEIFLFGPHPKKHEIHFFKTQWPGWLKYFEYYCSHKAFQEYWASSVQSEVPYIPGQGLDSDFEKFVDDIIKKQQVINSKWIDFFKLDPRAQLILAAILAWNRAYPVTGVS